MRKSGIAVVCGFAAAVTVAGAWAATSGVSAASGILPDLRVSSDASVPTPAAPEAAAAPVTTPPMPAISFGRPSPFSAMSALTRSTDAHIAGAVPLVLDPAAFGSKYAISIVDAPTGSAIVEHSAHAAMLPASTMKLVTAFTSLSVLGPKSRTTTSVVALGQHDIALVGGGDSLLMSGDIAKLAGRTAAAIARGSGACADSASPDESACVTGPVQVHFVDQRFGRWSAGPGWRKEYVPSVATPVSSLAYVGDYSSSPAKHVTKEFTKQLSRRGVHASYAGRSANAIGTTVASLPSRTVAAQVDWMLQRSENNIAEILFRQVAIEMGQPPTWAGAAATASALLTQAGLPVKGLVIKDGSGLSRTNRLSADLLSAILARAVDRPANPQLATIYYGDGLPTAGRSGTLAGRFATKKTKCAAGRVRAKTGSLRDVVSLAGVTRGVDGHPKVFAMMINNLPQTPAGAKAREAIDKVVTVVVGCV